MQSIALNLINFYQIFLSPKRGLLMAFAPTYACKYEVTCSEYTKQEIIAQGVLKGSYLGLRRIISCR